MPDREWAEGPHLLPISPVFDDQGQLLDRRTANPNAARSGLARLRSGLVRRERSHSRRTGAAGSEPSCQSARVRFRQTRRIGALLVADLPVHCSWRLQANVGYAQVELRGFASRRVSVRLARLVSGSNVRQTAHGVGWHGLVTRRASKERSHLNRTSDIRSEKCGDTTFHVVRLSAARRRAGGT